MPIAIYLLMLSLVCPALLLLVGEAKALVLPEMPTSGGLALKLSTLIVAALLISLLFRRREARTLGYGERIVVAALCLLSMWLLDFPAVAAFAKEASRTMGRQVAVGGVGLTLAFDFAMVAIAFGVVQPRFEAWLDGHRTPPPGG